MNRRVLGQLQPEQVFVEILLVQEAQNCTIDESEQGWNVELCQKQATSPDGYGMRLTFLTGQVLAYVFGQRKDEVFLAPQGITGTVWNQTLLY